MMTKKFVIELDVITGEVTFINEDEMTFIEILGSMEMAKLLLIDDWQDKT